MAPIRISQSWRRRLVWIVLFLYWPMLFVATHLSPPQLRQVQFQGNDKVLHFIAYFGLTLAFWLACYGFNPPVLRTRSPYMVLLMMLCYGAFDEISQTFVGRTASILDWTADAFGAVTALGLLYCLRRSLYWLILYWLLFAMFRHWPGDEPIFSFMPDHFATYSVAYLLIAYVALTLLWTRALSPVACWIIDRKTVILTLVCLPFYVIFDAWLYGQGAGGICAPDVFGGFMGIVLGLMVAVAFS